VWGFEESAQEPNVRFNVQPTTQPSGPEEDGCVKESEKEVDTEHLYGAGLFTEDHSGENCVRCSQSLKWMCTVCAECRKRALCVTGVRSDRLLFIIETNKCTAYIH